MPRHKHKPNPTYKTPGTKVSVAKFPAYSARHSEKARAAQFEISPEPMVKQGKRNVRRNNRRRRNGRNPNRIGAFRAVRINVKSVVEYKDADPRRWSWKLQLKDLVEEFTMYQQYRCTRIHVRIRPYDSNQTSGLSASVLLDSDGFGDFPTGKGASDIFTSVCETPGSKIRPRYQPITHVWFPSGPLPRVWRTVKDDYTIARLYLVNSSADKEVGGIVEVNATIMARGIVHGGTKLFQDSQSTTTTVVSEFDMVQSPLEDY